MNAIHDSWACSVQLIECDSMDFKCDCECHVVLTETALMATIEARVELATYDDRDGLSS